LNYFESFEENFDTGTRRREKWNTKWLDWVYSLDPYAWYSRFYTRLRSVTETILLRIPASEGF